MRLSRGADYGEAFSGEGGGGRGTAREAGVTATNLDSRNGAIRLKEEGRGGEGGGALEW